MKNTDRKAGKKGLFPARTAGPLFSGGEIRTALIIAGAFLLIGVAVTFSENGEDTVSQGYLVRESAGSSAYEEELQVTVGDSTETVTVEVSPRLYTEAEVSQYLADVTDRLEDCALGSQTPDHVDQDLTLPSALSDNPVRIEWLSGDTKTLTYEGLIGENVPESGKEVLMEADLTLQDREKTLYFYWTVYPKQLSGQEALAAGIQKELDEQDQTEEKLVLPEEYEGQSLSWQGTFSSTGMIIALLGMAAAVLYLFSGPQRRSQEEKKKRAGLLLDYPHIVSQLVLLLEAGLSMRKAFYKMSEDYREEKKQNGHIRAGYELIGRTCDDMDMGIPETEAYRRLGQRADILRYRTFSVLLDQNLRRGSRELIGILEREARSALEDRKNQVRVLGEEASARLLFPMILMLLIVFFILLVPAFLTLQ